MKKFFALTIALSLLTTSIFAQETEEEVVVEPTIEERVAVLEEAAATSPITFSGDLEFSIGTVLNENDTNYPVASGSSSATATLGLSALDDKVTAEVTIDFMASPTVATTLNDLHDTLVLHDELEEVSIEKLYYNTVDAYVTWWNDHCEDEASDGTALFDDTDRANITTAIDGLITGSLAMADADAIADYPEITLKSPVQTGTTPDADEFVLITGTLSNPVGAVDTAIETAIDGALTIIATQATGTYATDITGVAISYNAYAAVLNAYTETVIEAVTSDIRDAINDTLDLLESWEIAEADDFTEMTATSVVTQDFLSGAVISVKEIGGVLDLTMNFDSQHVAAGVFNLDMSGHEDDTTDDYPSFVASLSEDVVEGLSASVGFYINDEDADLDTLVADDEWTWLDEEVEAEDPKLGLTVGAGYSISIGEDATLDINADFGMYDLAGGDSLEWGFAVMPSFSGFNLNADVEFAYALDMIYLNVAADYTIVEMITPAVSYTFLSGMTDDVTLAWDDDASSVVGNFQHGGGSLLEFDVDVDLSDLLPIGLTVDGGIDLYLVTDMEIAWDAGLSVTPFDNFVVSGAISGDAVSDGDLAWNASVEYTYGIATLTGTVSQGYDGDDETDVISVGFSCSVSL